MPKKQTKEERVVAYLLRRGHNEMSTTSAKYRKFSPRVPDGKFYFVGKKGAVRLGKNVSNSISITAIIERRMKVEAREEKSQ